MSKTTMSSRYNLCMHYLMYLKNRAVEDRLTVNAGYLTYITLLSLVPLITVLVTALSKFPVFEGISDQIQEFAINNFVPAAGDAVKGALNTFIENTSSMTAVGGTFVFITAMMLISTIDKNLNYIWRVEKKRRLSYSFSMYWMILTLGPLLMGSSLAISSYITSGKMISAEFVSGFYRFLPMVLSVCGFVVIYLLVPNLKVKFSHALIGSIVAGSLFELSKKGFALYIETFPSYQLIYGALAAIPILFVWIYLCWVIVLIGAEVTASLGEKKQWHTDESFYFFPNARRRRLRKAGEKSNNASQLQEGSEQTTTLESNDLESK